MVILMVKISTLTVKIKNTNNQKAGGTSPAFVILRHIQLMHYQFLWLDFLFYDHL